MNCIIYGLIDPVTKQLRYIGQSFNGLQRAKCHMSDYAHGTNHHKRNWINKLKSLNLVYEIEILETVKTREELDEAEIFYIAYFKSIGCDLLNATAGGSGLWRPNLEVKQKMSAWQKGIPKSEEVKKKIAATLTGRVSTNKGRHLSPERLAAYVANRNVPFKDQHGVIYTSLKEAAEKLNLSKPNIHHVLNGKRKSTGGYIFEYIKQ
jgi:hypothetical protein